MPPPLDNFPVHLSASWHPLAKLLALSIVIAIPMLGWPAFIDRGHVVDDLMHSGTIRFIGALFLVLAIAGAALWRAATLSITSGGVDYRIGKQAYFYGWHDLERIDLARSGPKLIVRGMSDLRNGYNIIPAAFGVSAERLTAVLRDGLTRYGAVPPADASPTLAQGSDAAAIDARSYFAVVKFCALMGAFGTLALAFNVVPTYRQVALLQAHGQRAAAHVVRFYTDGCGRSGCSTDVEYQYPVWVAGERLLMHGHAFIAGKSYDPDLRLARSLGIVPIVYDVTNPASSALNYADHVYRRSPWANVEVTVWVFGFIIILITAGLAGSSWLAIWSRRRKLAVDRT